MNIQSKFILSAQMLEQAAAGYAGYAAAALLERDPAVQARFGTDALNSWKANLTQRLLELAAALTAEEPKLFVSRVLWSARAFRARDQDEQTVRLSLECLREVLVERLPESARVPPTDYLDKALAALETKTLVADALALDPEKDTDRLALRYLQRVMEGDVSGAIDEVVNATRSGLDVRSAYIDVLLPAQREIGRLWHLNEVSVAEEHLVTFTTQRTMAILAHTANSAPSNGKTAIVAAVATNIHDVGLRAVADLYQIAGWRAIFLGADVPMQDLPGMIKYFDADLLLLGATLATQLPRVQAAIVAIRSHSERPVKVIVGGAAFDEVQEVWKKVGADGYASHLNDAVKLGVQLTSG
ncbi:MAG: cobalamin-dependent protein [Gammaproteobacteria bacterium]